MRRTLRTGCDAPRGGRPIDVASHRSGSSRGAADRCDPCRERCLGCLFVRGAWHRQTSDRRARRRRWITVLPLLVAVLGLATGAHRRASANAGETGLDAEYRLAQASISTGYYQSCAITSAGGLQCWGAGSGGRIGDGTEPELSLVQRYQNLEGNVRFGRVQAGLRDAGVPVTLVTVRRYPVIQDVIDRAGLPDLLVTRTLDPRLGELNRRGARNGPWGQRCAIPYPKPYPTTRKRWCGRCVGRGHGSSGIAIGHAGIPTVVRQYAAG